MSSDLCSAAPTARHIEYFHDQIRIEHLVFEGALDGAGGEVRPDPDRPGLGLAFKEADAKRYAA